MGRGGHDKNSRKVFQPETGDTQRRSVISWNYLYRESSHLASGQHVSVAKKWDRRSHSGEESFRPLSSGPPPQTPGLGFVRLFPDLFKKK